MKKRFSDQHILENQPFRVVFLFLQREFRVMSLTGKKGARLGPPDALLFHFGLFLTDDV